MKPIEQPIVLFAWTSSFCVRLASCLADARSGVEKSIPIGDSHHQKFRSPLNRLHEFDCVLISLRASFLSHHQATFSQAVPLRPGLKRILAGIGELKLVPNEVYLFKYQLSTKPHVMLVSIDLPRLGNIHLRANQHQIDHVYKTRELNIYMKILGRARKSCSRHPRISSYKCRLAASLLQNHSITKKNARRHSRRGNSGRLLVTAM